MIRFFGTVILFISTVNLFSSDADITVTGSRIPEERSTSTEVLEVIDAEELERFDNVQDALSSVPMINVTGSGSGFVTMGGFGANGFARVLILVDGIPLNRPDMKAIDLSRLDIKNIERIEILRGAATARYGDQAVGGVINIITKKADGFAISVDINANELYSNVQSVQLSYGVEDYDVSLYARRGQLFSFRDNNDSYSLEGELKGEYRIGSASIGLGSNLKQIDFQMPGALSLDLFEKTPEFSEKKDNAEGYHWRSNFNFELESGDLYIGIPISFTKSYDETNFYSSYGDYFGTADLGVLDAQFVSAYDFYFGDFNSISLVVGFDSQIGWLDLTTSPNEERVSASSEDNITRISLDPWIQLQYSLNDFILVDAGARYSNLKADVTGTNLTGNFSHAPIVFDGSVAVLPFDGLKLSTSVAQFYRYPLIEEQVQFYAIFPAVPSVNLDIKPESGLSVTFAADVSSELISTTIAAYFIQMKDEIAYFSYVNQNMDDTLHYGGTLDAQLAYDGVSLSLGYGYDYAAFSAGDNKGKEIPLVPNHIITTAAGWETPIGLNVNTDFRWTSDFYVDGDFSNSLDKKGGRIDWNFTIDYTFVESLNVAFKISNILDDYSARYIANYGSAYEGYPVEGRHFELSVKWTY